MITVEKSNKEEENHRDIKKTKISFKRSTKLTDFC